MLQSEVSSSSLRAQKLHEAFQTKPSSHSGSLLVARETDRQGREESWDKPIKAERCPEPNWDTAQVGRGSDWALIPARPVLMSYKSLQKNHN